MLLQSGFASIIFYGSGLVVSRLTSELSRLGLEIDLLVR